MSTQFLVHQEIKEIVMNSKDGQEFLTLSPEGRNVYWILKIPSNNLNKEFIALLKFILPMNLYINGFFVNSTFQESDMSSKAFQYFQLLRSYFLSDDVHFLFNNQGQIEGRFLKVIGNKPVLQSKHQIKFVPLNEEFQNKFIILTSMIEPILLINNSRCLINECYANRQVLFYPDFNLLIEGQENYIEEEKEEIHQSYRKMSERILKQVISLKIGK